MASAANATATRATPRARHPRILFTMLRRSGRGRRRRRRPHTQAPDAPGIDVEHFELDTRWMAHDLAALRDAAEQREDQAADRIDLAPLVFRQHVADLLLQQFDGGTP